jgi:hypothetical protein
MALDVITSILIFNFSISSSFTGENLESFDIASTVFSIISSTIFSLSSFTFPAHHLISPFL